MLILCSLSDKVNVNEVNDDDSLSSRSRNDLCDEQKADVTLATCWKMTKEGKGGFVVSNELLYHQDKVEGQSVSQLCLPQSRIPHPPWPLLISDVGLELEGTLINCSLL